jgi:hypothetical protein
VRSAIFDFKRLVEVEQMGFAIGSSDKYFLTSKISRYKLRWPKSNIF